jgi:hypothetical protein
MVDIWSSYGWPSGNVVLTIVMQDHGFPRRRWNETASSCAHLPDVSANPVLVTPLVP